MTCETPVKCDESGDNCDDEIPKMSEATAARQHDSCTEALLDCKKKADPNYKRLRTAMSCPKDKHNSRRCFYEI